MKKVCIVFCCIIVLGGLAFFFGWAQFTVPPGAYGVMLSKTHGLDPRIIRSGEFRWLWYKLIPGNVAITVFRVEPVSHRFSAANTLPSGDTYAAFAGAGANFSWRIDGSLSFAIDPEALPALAGDKALDGQEALDALEGELAGQIGAFITRRLGSGELEAGQVEAILASGTDAVLEREIHTRFPMIRDFSCAINAAQFPDFALYAQVRRLYEEFVARQGEYVSDALGRQAAGRIEERMRFDELEQYGVLLSRYPVLLEYLAIERGGRDKTE
jgi:hypothetical protein